MITVAPMTSQDIDACTDIVNHIIAMGGTTAYETPYSPNDFKTHYLHDTAICMVARSGDQISRFQGLFEVASGTYSIGTFAEQRKPVKGVGRALFEATLAAAKARGGHEILAIITSDNTGGQIYYDRMGFVDHELRKADLTRSDGTVVDRVVKRFPL